MSGRHATYCFGGRGGTTAGSSESARGPSPACATSGRAGKASGGTKSGVEAAAAGEGGGGVPLCWGPDRWSGSLVLLTSSLLLFSAPPFLGTLRSVRLPHATAAGAISGHHQQGAQFELDAGGASPGGEGALAEACGGGSQVVAVVVLQGEA
eukprot:scaffold11929_cov107-Isochrysis_galbana.AAC.10